jgi:hypothetical protein
MQPFCSSHRAVAIDIEGMGQSFWPTVSQDIRGDARGFMGKLQLTLLEKLGVCMFVCVLLFYPFFLFL